MRDRLIELVMNTPKLPITVGGRNNGKTYQTAGNIADHLLANGVIVPPCKVGQTVYSYLHRWKKEDGIAPYQITNITITQNKKGTWVKKYRAMQVVDGKTIDWQFNFDFDDIGKTVFLTKQEAEKALKGGAEE